MRGPRACMRLGVQAREYVGDAIVIFQLHRGIGCVRSGPNASYGPRSPPILPTRVGGFLLGLRAPDRTSSPRAGDLVRATVSRKGTRERLPLGPFPRLRPARFDPTSAKAPQPDSSRTSSLVMRLRVPWAVGSMGWGRVNRRKIRSAPFNQRGWPNPIRRASSGLSIFDS